MLVFLAPGIPPPAPLRENPLPGPHRHRPARRHHRRRSRRAILCRLRRGAAYGAFFLALSSLRDAAETSKLVRRCGQHLVAQPPGLRYAALTGGGHLFGIILSYGAIELLGAMVMRANTLQAAGGSETTRDLRSRRMLMAIYRGFCVMNCWSPLKPDDRTVVSTAVPAAPMRMLLPIAFVVSVGMAAIGWLEDRLSAARLVTSRPTTNRPVTTESWSIHLRILAWSAWSCCWRNLAASSSASPSSPPVTLIVPMVGLGWAIVQAWRFVTGANHLARTTAVLRRRAGRFSCACRISRSEATVLAGSGFMGVAVGGALPAAGLAPFIAHLPPIGVPLLVPVILIATGQLGSTPSR